MIKRSGHRHLLRRGIIPKDVIGDGTEALANSIAPVPRYFRLSHDHRRIVAYLNAAATLRDLVFRLFDVAHNRPLQRGAEQNHTQDRKKPPHRFSSHSIFLITVVLLPTPTKSSRYRTG